MLYFDNAATTFPKPNSVVRAVHSAVTEYGGNPGRGGHDISMRVSEKVYAVRKKAADFFHTTAENVVFTGNCTASLNLAIKGVLRAGDHVILSCLEHNSVIRPVYKLAQDGVVSYDIAPVYDCDPQATLAAFEQRINKKTRAIICTHASNVSGLILPIRQLGELCRQYGLVFIVDAAQTAGVLPIDMEQDQIDLLCMPGHKGLYGITGSGMLLLRNTENPPLLDTLLEGGTGSLSIQLEQPDFSPDRYESGTVNTAGIFSIGAGIDFIRSKGMERIYRHEFDLCRRFQQALSEMSGIMLCHKEYRLYQNAPIVSFNVKGCLSEEVTEELNRRGFALRGGLHCAPLAHEHYNTLDCGMVRFAPSAFSQETGVSQLIQNLAQISKKFPVQS